jgi:Lactate racemase N-terminal domain
VLVQLPRMIDIIRLYPDPLRLDIRNVLAEQFSQTGALARVKPGARIAIAVGSRGIANLQEIVSLVVQTVREKGAHPFIVPAMGSHGGATPEGQARVLAEYGITSQAMGVALDTTMDVEPLGQGENGIEVFFSRAALASDGIIAINRIKPHTDFSGALGSGILKMLAIGLGKREGAATGHAAATRFGHEFVIRAVSRVVLRKAPILCGVALVEDAKHHTADLRVLAARNLEQEEEKLFAKAQLLMPKLPFDEIDLLIVDYTGKELSGTGMDTNIIKRSIYGYSSSLRTEVGRKPYISRIFVRDLTETTNGNALGIGLADFTTTRVVRRIDLATTYTNSLTALAPATAKIPIYFDTDRECIEHAVLSLALPESAAPAIVRISSTLDLERMQVSEMYIEEASKRSDLSMLGSPHEMEFDREGNLYPLSSPGAA